MSITRYVIDHLLPLHQINTLMKNHEKAFSDIKNYYNDITLNNLALINTLKEQVEEMKKKEERLEKQMNEITAENKKLTEPLQKVCDQPCIKCYFTRH